MTSRDFCFWLRGYFEMTNEPKLTEKQVKMINAHLDLVFEDLIRQERPPVVMSSALSDISLRPKIC